ncbi:transketolase, partial [bacterium]|nr:transketolase [bacterium]
GEDGPTHQPVEHLSALRAIPNLVTILPGDANKVAEAWKLAIETRHQPTALVLTRQALPTIDRNIYATAEGLRKGAYVLADLGIEKPKVILMASGSEVNLIFNTGKRLEAEGISVRLVSFPSWELFEQQTLEYRDSVLLPDVTCRVSVEAGISQGWHRWVGPKGFVLGLDRYGASAPAGVVFKNLGFSEEHILQIVHDLLK